jgi:hypothetical protein
VDPLPQDPNALVGKWSRESGLRWELARSAVAVTTMGIESTTDHE